MNCPPGKFRTLLAISITGALLSACASFDGIGSSAELRTPADYATAASLPAQAGTWPDSSWANPIGGAPLQALLNEALAGNPSLQVAAARLAAVRAIAEATDATSRPIASANLNSTYQRFTEYGLVPPPLAGSFQTDNRLALNFSYDLDFWGRHGADLRAALAQTKMAETEQHAARLWLTTAVAHAWIQLARQHAQLELTEQQLQLREKIERLTQQRIAAGLDNQSDNSQAQLQLATLRAEQAQWQEAIALTRNQIAALLGQGPDRGLQIARPMLLPFAEVALPDQLPLALLGRRPDIVASRWSVEAAQGETASAKAAFYPNINLTAFAGLSSLGLSSLLESGSRIAGIGPAISLPLFDGGRLRAQLKGKVAAYDGAVATYNQTLTTALQEVADQVQSLHAVETQLRYQQSAAQAAAKALQLAQQRQQVGTANLLQVLSAESAWLTQRKLELDTQMRRTDVRLGLIKALGGGFDANRQGLTPVPAPAPGNTSVSRSFPSHPSFAKTVS
jgi:NodT family efflux transporter outer membrane factor (OMF) lipoprotein